ncbi:ATP-dependent DNA ligase [Mobilicoccus pelagius]|uniref:DNA ligase (ATP) n=1 Tax=Mobilicoccus pelagius NBRC 104925 TaxID=1089455 RepID=H5UUJ4_9MICO|nr:ATP-dependent DNA ligase [Mobilicoccus pelagius]GAB49402.1 ATP-dependent DNA ligase LigC [Mobilicoccus pelagius NBRC 104925]
MDLPVPLPLAPMLAKSVAEVPESDSVAGGLAYEPKWDGFRCLVLRDGDELELASRGSKTLTRYFPELREPLLEVLPRRCLVDGEIVVRSGRRGAERLDWDALSQRIHPAASRIATLAERTPAEIVAFDLVALDDESLLDVEFAPRRARLEDALAGRGHDGPLHLTRATRDAVEAQEWFVRFEGAGLDGVVAKPLAGPYTPGRRTMLKVKHKRTAEAVVTGYRVHKSGAGVGSLLLSLYADDGHLIGVGGIAAFTAKRRLELVEELEPLVLRDEDGGVVHAETDRSRFSGNKDVGYVPLRPERVVEVAFDQLEGQRFRHAVTFLRWRPDRDPESCTLAQIDVAPAYDLGAVLDE